MPELGLYLVEEDEYSLVQLAFDEGCDLIPDLHYNSQRYEKISTLEGYRQYRIRTRLFFLVSEKYFCCPIEMCRIEKDERHVYYISQRSGGPTIQFLGGGLFEKNGQKFIRSGSIAYYPTYWNTTTLQKEKPPSGLPSVYNVLRRGIKRDAIRIKPGLSEFWLCAHARKELLDGANLVGFEQYRPDRLAGYISSD